MTVNNGANLLRMLEPPVRPGAAPAPLVKPKVPIEQEPFSELLAQIGQQDAAASADPTQTPSVQLESLDAHTASDEPKEPAPSLLLKRLGRLDNIPNPTVIEAMSPPHDATNKTAK